MKTDKTPEIKKVNIETAILKIKQFGFDNILDFNFFESPEKNQL